MPPIWIQSTEDHPWRKMAVTARRLGEADLRLDGSSDQAWEGAGGCFNELGWVALQKLGERERNRVIHALFGAGDTCRFNLCRLPVGANDYSCDWYSLAEKPGDLAMRSFSITRDQERLIPFIRAAQRHRDLTLFASPWSPPTWMKSPAVYNFGTLVWEKPILEAYARYFVRFVQEYAKAGIPIHQIHPQNEVSADQKFPSCKWTGRQMRDFIRDHLGPAFARAGLSTEIWCGTLNDGRYNEWALPLLDDPACMRYVKGWGLQYAGKDMAARLHAAHPGLRLMQTENECGWGKGDNTWDYAHYIWNLIHHYITNGAVGYIYWNMVLEPEGQSTWGWKQNAMITVDAQRRKAVFNPEFYVMKHLACHVAPGARRIGLAGGWSGNAYGFRNPDGSLVLCLQNPLPEARTVTVALPTGQVALKLAGSSFHTLVG